jgi:Domain of unknown function (DUF4396)
MHSSGTGSRDAAIGRSSSCVAQAADGTPSGIADRTGAGRGIRASWCIVDNWCMESATHAQEHAHHEHQHHEMSTEGAGLTRVAIDATMHCLTGCAIGEISGMAIATAVGMSNVGSIVLSIALAFVFGYSLTSLPLLRAGIALAAVIPIALASDTFSIATMEAVDNAIIAVVPGALDAGLADLLFWGSLAFSLAIAAAVAVPVNRWLIARGRGHCAVHETGIHGGPSPRLILTISIVAFVFGAAVLIAEAAS